MLPTFNTKCKLGWFLAWILDSTSWLLGARLVISRSLVQIPARALWDLSFDKTVYSIFPQSTQVQNGYLASIRKCLELVRYMLPAVLEYPSGDWNGFRVYRPASEGRSCEHIGGYKTINRIPFESTRSNLVTPCLYITIYWPWAKDYFPISIRYTKIMYLSQGLSDIWKCKVLFHTQWRSGKIAAGRVRFDSSINWGNHQKPLYLTLYCLSPNYRECLLWRVSYSFHIIVHAICVVCLHLQKSSRSYMSEPLLKKGMANPFEKRKIKKCFFRIMHDQYLSSIPNM